MGAGYLGAGNANKRTALALDFRRWGLGTLRGYKNEVADPCLCLNDLYGSGFTERDIDNVIRYACARHDTAHGPELFEAIGHAANLCALTWDPSLEMLRLSVMAIEVCYSDF